MPANKSRENIEDEMRAMLDGGKAGSAKFSGLRIENQVRRDILTKEEACGVLLHLAEQLLQGGFSWSGHAVYRAADVLMDEPEPTPPQHNKAGRVRKPKPPGYER
jgi:hypothetical protein